MRGLDVGSLPICDCQRLVGMLTDRDIAVRSTAGSEHPATVSAGGAWIMRYHGIRRLLVLDQNQRLVGVVSLDDLATDAGDERLAGEVVRRRAADGALGSAERAPVKRSHRRAGLPPGRSARSQRTAGR
jgi:CBS-domain-containing membrane protein